MRRLPHPHTTHPTSATAAVAETLHGIVSTTCAKRRAVRCPLLLLSLRYFSINDTNRRDAAAPLRDSKFGRIGWVSQKRSKRHTFAQRYFLTSILLARQDEQENETQQKMCAKKKRYLRRSLTRVFGLFVSSPLTPTHLLCLVETPRSRSSAEHAFVHECPRRPAARI